MKTRRIPIISTVLLISLGAASMYRAGVPLTTGMQTAAATSKVVAAANAFIATLSDAEKAKLTFSFNNSQKTTGWSNLPSGIFQRNGLRLGDMSPRQRDAAFALVASALS